MKGLIKVIAAALSVFVLSGPVVTSANYAHFHAADIKAESTRKIKKAKQKQRAKNKRAKTIKNNNHKLRTLNAEKRKQVRKSNELKKTINHKTKYSHIAVPISDANQKPTKKNTIARNSNLPITLVDPKIPGKKAPKYDQYYVYKRVNDKSERITSYPTAAQQEELANYAITLINSYQKANGQSPVVWTKHMQEHVHTLVKSSSRGYVDIEPYDGSMNYVRGLPVQHVANGQLTPTMLELKVQTLNALTHRFYGNYPHPEPASYLANSRVGFAIDRGSRSPTARYPFFLHVSFVEDYSKGKIPATGVKQPTFANNYRKNVYPTKETADLKKINKKIAKLNKQIKTLDKKLTKTLKKQMKQNEREYQRTKKQAKRVMDKKLSQL